MSTLGVLLETIRHYPHKAAVTCGFGGVGTFDSYRGYYEDLALDPAGEVLTVGELLHSVLDADGATFQGYKGGDFHMSMSSSLWIASYGQATSLRFLGASFNGHTVFLHSREVEGW